MSDQRPLGDALVRMGLLTSGQLDAMLSVQRRDGKQLSRQLVELGFLTEERLVQILGDQLGVETIDLAEVQVHERVLALVLPSVARRLIVLPIARRRVGTSDALVLAMADPLDDDAVAVVGRRLPPDMRVVRLLAGEDDILRAIDMLYGPPAEDDVGEPPGRPPIDDLELPTPRRAPDNDAIGPEATIEEMAPDERDPFADPLGDPATAPSDPPSDPESLNVTEAAVPALGHRAETSVAAEPSALRDEPATTVSPAPPMDGPASSPRTPRTPVGVRSVSLPPADPVVGGPKSGGVAAARRAPATEVVRTRDGVDASGRGERIKEAPERAERPLETRPEPQPYISAVEPRARDVTRRLGPPVGASGSPAHAGEVSDGPEVLVRAVTQSVPPALLAVAAVSLVGIIGIVAWSLSRPRTVDAKLGPTTIVDPSAAVEPPTSHLPNPPLAPIRGPMEIAPGVLDGPPPAGHKFVLVEGLELRATAAADAEALLWLRGGQLVTVLRSVGDSQLVMVPPDGPAGFVRPSQLGNRKPLAALAREMKFKGCVVEKGAAVDDCLYGARVQWDECRVRCRSGTRCASACETAFNACLTACRASEDAPIRSARPRRRR